MSRILVSWFAVNHDLRDTQVVEEGPTVNFHRYYWEHDRHLILYNHDRFEPEVVLLENYLGHHFPKHRVALRKLPINDVIDLQEVKTKTERLLLELEETSIDIYFSPGTSIMQLSWYICHTTLALDTRLLQLRPPRFDPKNQRPERLYVEVTRDQVPASALIKQVSSQSGRAADHLITPSLKPIYERASQIAQADHVRVVISGESGTGKENLARFLHRQSARAQRPFYAINCASLTDELLSSQLFGHTKGAFTNAYGPHRGLLDLADGGTVFLDEIGDISPFMQQALLRFLQEGEILPLGSNRVKKVDVRIIAATNQDLTERCQEGQFRWDLYYRLAVTELALPPLRRWQLEEVEVLLDFLLEKKRSLFNRPLKLRLDEKARTRLLRYPYPGNVREMENVVENLYVFAGEKVTVEDLPARLRADTAEAPESWREVEKAHLKRVYDRYHRNKTHTSQAIGYSLNTLKKKLREHGIEA